MSMKNFNDTLGNRTRDLTTCSAVPQPIAQPRTALPNLQIHQFRLAVSVVSPKAWTPMSIISFMMDMSCVFCEVGTYYVLRRSALPLLTHDDYRRLIQLATLLCAQFAFRMSVNVCWAQILGFINFQFVSLCQDSRTNDRTVRSLPTESIPLRLNTNL